MKNKEVINSKDLGPTLSALYELNVVKQKLSKKDEEIKELKTGINHYKVIDKLQRKEIDNLQTELETYRPTILKGEGQCICNVCEHEQSNWTDFYYKYEGKIYCYKCFKNVETRDKRLRHQVCEEIKEKLKVYRNYTDEENIGWYIEEENIDKILDQIEQGEN